MDIKIEAPKHENQAQLIKFYTEKLSKKFKKFNFIISIDLKVIQEKNGVKKVSIQIKPEKSDFIYSEHKDRNENVALNESIAKMYSQLNKYKTQHYHSRTKPDIQ